MMKIPFEATRCRNTSIDPRKGGQPVEVPFEIRLDPLTGRTGRVFDVPFQAYKPDFSSTVEQSRETFCPFCPENIEKSTSLFPEEIIPGGRIKVGESTLFPNLIPYDKYAAVAVFSHRHYIPMEDLDARTMRDVFTAAMRFIRAVYEHDPRVRYASINWNYHPPAGSSIVHPHLQPNCGEVPTNELRLQLEGSRRYFRENGRGFWGDFIETEKRLGVRHVAEAGPVTWTTSFVPLGFLPDLCCIFREHSSPLSLDESEVVPFLDGLARVLTYFRDQNIFSFNISIFSVKEDKGFRMNGRVCPRLLPRPIGNSDMAYLQTLHREPFTLRTPETVCQEVRKYFG